MADKKISELPLLSSVSGSSIIIPIVHDGTTIKLNLSQLGHYASQWSAKTGSANTFTGTQSIIGNVNISGKLSVNSIEAVYETSSILYTSGSTQIGDQITDIHTIVGTVNLNGLALGTNELMAQTASQAAVNLGISSTTGSINTTTSSFDSVFLRISSVTGSINVQSSSQDLINRGISSVTGAMNTTTSSFNSEFNKIGSTTASIHFATSSLNSFTGSIIGQNNTIATFTSSVNFATQSLNTQTGSQDLVNRGISSVTGSINTTTASFDSVFQRISSTTGSINTTTSSFNSEFNKIGSTTASIHFTTGALNAFTGSLIGQTNTISTFTSSINFTTQSLNTQTGSQDLVNRGISSVTGSINNTTSSFDLVFRGISSVTGAINLTTSSLIGITNGLMAFTAALDNTYATDAQLYQLYQATASIHSATASLNTQTGSQSNLNAQIGIATSSLNTQTGSQSNLNAQIGIATSSLNTFSGSIRSEINLLEAYTASLKAVAIVSSSTQISNYYKFAETASANTFYGTQTINGNLQLSSANPLVYNAGNTNAMLFGFYDGGAIYGPYYQIFGNNYSNAGQRGGAEFVYDTRNGGDGNFHVSSYNGSAWTQKFRVDDDGIEVTGSALVSGDVRANKFVFTDGVINTNVGGQYIIATSGNVTYLYTGTSGLNINDATNGNINVSISNVGAVQTRGKLTVGSPGNDQDIAFGGSNAKLDWAGTGAQIFYSVGALQFSSVGTTNNMILQQQAGALFNAGITGSLMATNNVVSSSTQIVNYNLFARTGSANTFYGAQSVSGSLFVTSNSGFGTSDATGSGILKVISAGTQNAFSIGQSNSKRWTGFGANDLKVYGDDYFITTVDAFPLSIGTNNTSRITIANDGGINATGAITASNFRISTAGGGIDFSATANSGGTMTSELLNDYEEGTWTPTDGSGAGLTFTVVDARYTKIGRQVQCFAQIGYPTTANGNNAVISGLPFTQASTSGAAYGAFIVYTNYGSTITWLNTGGATTTSAYSEAGANLTNTNLSAKQFRLVWIYEV